MSDAKQSVLLIDDDPLNRELFGEILGEQCTIHTAGNIETAMQIIDSEPLSAIVSDFHLGQCDATELFQWVRSSHPDLAHRFVLLTGDKLADLKLFRTQATVLYKPVEIEMLLETVTKLTNTDQEPAL